MHDALKNSAREKVWKVAANILAGYTTSVMQSLGSTITR